MRLNRNSYSRLIAVVAGLVLSIGAQFAHGQGWPSNTAVGGIRVSAGIQVLYVFGAGSGDTVQDVSGVGSPLNLAISDTNNVAWVSGGGLVLNAPVVITSGSSTKITDVCQATQAVTVEAWIAPANTSQSGPARIVSHSLDGFPSGGNFMLGQDGAGVEARLRTTLTNQYGNNPAVIAPDVLGVTLVHLVYTRNATGAKALYVDGALSTTGSTGGDFSSWGDYALTLCNEPDGARPWLGTIYIVAVYDRALSAPEVTQNFEAGPTVDVLPVAPSIVVQPQDRTVIEGATATFSVQANGTLPLSYQWRRNSADIAGGNASTYTTPALTVTGDNGAQYQCTVANSAGNVTSNTATLTVQVAGPRVSTGLQALYGFHEGSGTTVQDISGVGASLDLTISDSNAVTWLPGGGLVLGASVVITSGTSSKITNACQATQGVTVEAWVDPANISQAGPARIVAQSLDGFPNGGNFMLGQDGTGVEARLRTTGTNQYGSPALLAAGVLGVELVHLVYTRDATGAKAFYVDGVLTASGITLGEFSGWGEYALTLGNEPDGARPWLGTLFAVAVYDRALDAGEVAQNFGAGPSVPPLSDPPADPTGLVAFFSDQTVDLNWDDNDEDDLDGYTVYRSTSSGGPYSAVNGVLLSASQYSDTGLVNGMMYYYVVVASNVDGWESGYSNEFSATPTVQLLYTWPEGPLYGVVTNESSSVKTHYPGGENQYYRDLATHDFIEAQSWQYFDYATTGWGDTWADSIRAYNPDAVIVYYLNIFARRYDSENNNSVPFQRDLFAAINDADLWLYNTDGTVADNVFPAKRLNPVRATADTLVAHVLRSLRGSPTNDPWVGLMLDFTDYPNPPQWPCGGVGTICNDNIDIDRDSIPYNDDLDDQALYRDFFEYLYEQLDLAYQELRPNGDYVLMSNGYGTIKPETAPSLDMIYYEGTDRFVNNTAIWDSILNGVFDSGFGSKRGRFNRPVAMYEAMRDSSQFWCEAISLVGKGLSYVWHTPVPGYTNPTSTGRSAGPSIRHLDFATGAPVGDATIVTASNPGFAVASRVYENITAYAWVNATSADMAMPQPYLIVTNGANPDTLSRGGGWPQQTPVAKSEVKDSLPRTTGLLPNVPNPFNPHTAIKFDLARPSEILVNIYDVSGRLVRRLGGGALSAGQHELVWTGRDDQGRSLPSGAYYVQLTAGSKIDLRKILLLK